MASKRACLPLPEPMQVAQVAVVDSTGGAHAHVYATPSSSEDSIPPTTGTAVCCFYLVTGTCKPPFWGPCPHSHEGGDDGK